MIVLALFIPGLAVTLALFPKPGQIKWAERIGLSLVFGIIPQLILYFLTKNLRVPVTTTTSQLSILLITAAGIIIWRWRQSRGG